MEVRESRSSRVQGPPFGAVFFVRTAALNAEGAEQRDPKAQTGMPVPRLPARSRRYRLGDGGDEFGQAEDAAVVAVFALDVVHASPRDLGLVVGRRDAGYSDFDFDAVVEAAEVYLAGRGAMVVKRKAELASGDDGGFELLDVVVGKASGVGEDAHRATHGGGQAFVVIEREAKVERVLGHGYWLPAQETSQASRQSGQ